MALNLNEIFSPAAIAAYWTNDPTNAQPYASDALFPVFLDGILRNLHSVIIRIPEQGPPDEDVLEVCPDSHMGHHRHCIRSAYGLFLMRLLSIPLPCID